VAEPNDRVVPPSLVQRWAEQLGQTITSSRIRIQQLHSIFHNEDTHQGELQVPSYDAFQATQEPQHQITGARRLVDGRHGKPWPNSPGKPLSWFRSGKQSTPVGKRWLLQLEIKYSYCPGTCDHFGLQRSLITNAQDCIWEVRSSIRMLTMYTCSVPSEITAFSTCRFSLIMHSQPEVSHHQNHTQRWSRNQRHGQLTANSNLGGTTGRSDTTSNGPVTTTYARAWNQ